MKFIEVQALFEVDEDAPDWEELGLLNKAIENSEPLPCLVNIDSITYINEASEGRCSIEFKSGARNLLDHTYDEVKNKIIKAIND